MMKKENKLAQIADALRLIDRLVEEYNEEAEEENFAWVTSVSIKNVDPREPKKLNSEIHLHGNFHDLDIPFTHTAAKDEELWIIHDYAVNFHGARLTTTEFEYKEVEEEHAKLAV